jgi:uncharacterized protein
MRRSLAAARACVKKTAAECKEALMAEPVNVVMNEKTRQFEASVDGQTAFAEYRLVDHGIILPHTVVPEAHEGKGVGSALAKAALGYAREQGLKVIPTCPFIAGYIRKHPEWHDIVHDTYRMQLGIDAA